MSTRIPTTKDNNAEASEKQQSEVISKPPAKVIPPTSSSHNPDPFAELERLVNIAGIGREQGMGSKNEKVISKPPAKEQVTQPSPNNNSDPEPFAEVERFAHITEMMRGEGIVGMAHGSSDRSSQNDSTAIADHAHQSSSAPEIVRPCTLPNLPKDRQNDSSADQQQIDLQQPPSPSTPPPPAPKGQQQQIITAAPDAQLPPAGNVIENPPSPQTPPPPPLRQNVPSCNVNEIPSPRTPPLPASRQNAPAVNNPPSPRTPPPPPSRQNVFVPAGSPPTPPPPSKERVQQRQNVFDFAYPPVVGDNVPPPCTMPPRPPPTDQGQRQNGMAAVSDPQPSQDNDNADRVPSPSTPPRPILPREPKMSASAAALVSNPTSNLNINNGAAASPLTPPVDPNPKNSSAATVANCPIGMNGPPPPPAFLQQNSQQFKLLQHRPQMEHMLASQLGLNLREESGCLLVSSSNPPLSNRVLVFTDEGDTIQVAEFIDDLMQETMEEWKKLDIGQFLRAVHGKCMAFFRQP